MNLNYRQALPSDHRKLRSIYHESAKTLGSKKYSPEQTKVWASFSEAPEFEEFITGVYTELALYNNEIAGFLGLGDDGHLLSMYVHPDFSGKKISSQLIERAFLRAKKLGISKIYTEASLLAHPVFLHFGFEVIEKEEVERAGIIFTRYKMSKASPFF